MRIYIYTQILPGRLIRHCKQSDQALLAHDCFHSNRSLQPPKYIHMCIYVYIYIYMFVRTMTNKWLATTGHPIILKPPLSKCNPAPALRSASTMIYDM